MTHKHPIFAVGAALAGTLSAGSQAGIISSTVDTFTGLAAVPAEYTIFDGNAANTNLIVAGPFVTDRDALGDGLNDGSIEIGRNPSATGSVTVGTTRDLGVIDAGDIGSIVSIDVAYERITAANFSTTYAISLTDSGTTTSVDSLLISTFGSGSDPAGTVGHLSAVNGGSPLTYTIQSGDVGSQLTFTASLFASTSNGRRLALDTVDIAVTPIPEPASLALTGLGGLALLSSRRRRTA